MSQGTWGKWLGPQASARRAAVLVWGPRETCLRNDGPLLISTQNRVRCPGRSPKERTSFWEQRERKRKM